MVLVEGHACFSRPIINSDQTGSLKPEVLNHWTRSEYNVLWLRSRALYSVSCVPLSCGREKIWEGVEISVLKVKVELDSRQKWKKVEISKDVGIFFEESLVSFNLFKWKLNLNFKLQSLTWNKFIVVAISSQMSG